MNNMVRHSQPVESNFNSSKNSFDYGGVKQQPDIPNLEEIQETEDLLNILLPSGALKSLSMRKILVDTCHRLNSKVC